VKENTYSLMEMAVALCFGMFGVAAVICAVWHWTPTASISITAAAIFGALSIVGAIMLVVSNRLKNPKTTAHS